MRLPMLLAAWCALAGGYAMPDPSLTPGVVAETRLEVICEPGYAGSVRPDRNMSFGLKVEAMKRYDLYRWRPNGPSRFLSDYEADHLIPLELGGAPADIRNIWPQPIEEALVKDKLEHEMHRQVCAGERDLAQTQAQIARDWTALLK